MVERYGRHRDVRGHGLSQPMGEDFTIPLAVDDLLVIVDALGYKQAVFVGHSNGTYIAQELAFREPARVQALVIADGTCITWSHSSGAMLLLRLKPNCTYVVIPNARHFAMLDNVDFFKRILMEFLTKWVPVARAG